MTAPVLQSLYAAARQNQKPNILFITTDYTRGIDLPSYGAPFLKMPNVNRLCQEGAVFTNHVSTSPICMPARASWVTGCYPHTHGMWDNLSYSFRRNGPFLMRDLQQLGYFTVGIGKMHFHPWQEDYNFHIRIVHEGQDLGNQVDDDYNKYFRQHGFDRDQIRKFRGTYEISGGQAVYNWPLDEKLHHDCFVGDESIKVITTGRMNKDIPWFMWISFSGPHNPWNPPKRCADLYRMMEDLPTGDFVEGELNSKPLEYTRHRYGYGKKLLDVYDKLPEGEKAKMRHEIRAAHYGSLTFIDEQIGKIIQSLGTRDMLENTIIVYTSDHGSALFDNEMLHKGTVMPTQLFVPFVIWRPGYVKPGVRRHFSAHVDVYPTLIELAGGTPHLQAEGKSLVPLFLDPESKIKTFDVMECSLVTAIITEKWIAGFHHFNYEIDLYDRQIDPMCHKNLAGDEKYTELINQLRKMLVRWRRQLSPNIEIPENPLEWRKCLGPEETIARFRKNQIEQYKRLIKLEEGTRPGRIGKQVADFLREMGEN